MPMQILYSAAVSECCDVKDIPNYFPFHKGHATYTFLNLGGMAVGNKEPVEYFQLE